MFHLVTGGSGSGKSLYAEERIAEFKDGQRIYIATMNASDPESMSRIERHRKMRKNKNFRTVECFTGLSGLQLPAGCNVLLEDMGNLMANEMFMQDGAGIHAYEAVREGVDHLMANAENLVIVTNEIFSDGIIYEDESMLYQKFMGKINQYMAGKAGRVTELVYGIPVTVKDIIKRT